MRFQACAGAALTAVLMVACGTPGPAPRLYQLRTEAPAAAAAVATTSQAARPVWELAAEVRVPAYLERETLVVLGGSSRLELLEGQRWAEPLRDVLPRLLRHDLALLRGASSVWLAPAPPGVAVARQLRVEILSLQADSARGAVVLQARWWFSSDRDRNTAPQAMSAELQVAVANTGDGEAIAAAHRLALWQLAERIVK